MAYTGKGDKGKTTLYHCNQSLSKSSIVAEALGTLDEIGSLLGWCKTKTIPGELFGLVIEKVQNDLFFIQAELAGSSKRLPSSALKRVEDLIKKIDKELPPIKNFIISGGLELSAMLDVARTVARRAERQVVAVQESGGIKFQPTSLAYLNRLSSLLYALARLVNYRAGLIEKKPEYK